MSSSAKKRSLIRALYRHISARRKQQFRRLLCLTVLASFAEIISLGAVVPFIAVVTQPDEIFTYPFMTELAAMFNIIESAELVAPISILFVFSAVSAGGLRVAVLNFSIRLSNKTGADLSTDMFRRTLFQPYSVHIARSSSEILSGVTQKVSTAINVLTAMITVITNFILFLSILIALILVDPFIAVGAISAFGLLYLLITLFTRKVLKTNSSIIAQQQSSLVRSSQEGLGAIRDILIDKSQENYSIAYSQRVRDLQYAVGTNQFITLAPRYVMEGLALVMIGLFTFVVSDDAAMINTAMPTLAALALGAQRLLPVLQQLYGNFSLVSGSRQSLVDVVALLDQPIPDIVDTKDTHSILFEKILKLEGVSFKYTADGPCIFSDLRLNIEKGTMIGLVGETGSGKSTVIDLIMGLLDPSEGIVSVDGVALSEATKDSWQKNIAHVPQHIFLADSSIAENIAFGVSVEEIDYERVARAGKQAQMSSFVAALPEGYSTIVGERGVKFSGGQRQRIGIARALYKQASVLILDEATSALDSHTERLVIEAINGLSSNLTVIMIAHRISTLRKCDKIIEFTQSSGGKVVSFESLIDSYAVDD